MVVSSNQILDNMLYSFSNWNNNLTYMFEYLHILKSTSVKDVGTRLLNTNNQKWEWITELCFIYGGRQETLCVFLWIA